MAPKGKPITVHTLTPVPASRSAHSGTQQELTHTEANSCSAASSQSFSTCARVALALRMVWSMYLFRLMPSPP